MQMTPCTLIFTMGNTYQLRLESGTCLGGHRCLGACIDGCSVPLLLGYALLYGCTSLDL